MIEKVQRHKYIMNLLEGSSVPVKGTVSRRRNWCQSRQMIVKDIDELRKNGSVLSRQQGIPSRQKKDLQNGCIGET